MTFIILLEVVDNTKFLFFEIIFAKNQVKKNWTVKYPK